MAASASATMSATHFCRANVDLLSATSKLTFMITKTEENHDLPADVKNDLDDNKNFRAPADNLPAVARHAVIRNMTLVDYVPSRTIERRARHGDAGKEIK